MTGPAEEAARILKGAARWRVLELLFWLAVLASYFLFPGKHLILTEIAWLALFALSLDLILGYAGIISLGHAAYFGFGAYVAGLLAQRGIVAEPVTGLILSGTAAGVIGFFTSFLVLRGSDLTRIMVTLGISLVLREIFNQLDWLSGGANGLQGVNLKPILGLFEFDIFGHVGYAYCLIVFFVLFLLARRIIHSPFGLSLRAIKNNPLRAAAAGVPVNARLVAVYTLAAAYAGIAGALLTQSTAFASLDVFSFERSADLLLVLIIGGTGYLYGGPIGAVVFKLVQDWLASLTPQYWQFWIGLLLVLIVLVDRRRIENVWRGFLFLAAKEAGAASGRIAMSTVLETVGLEKRFGGLAATCNLSFRLEKGARQALIGPNGAGKTTLINLLTGVLPPTSGRILLDGAEITGLAPHRRVRRGLARTFQITQLFPALTPLEAMCLAVGERKDAGRRWLGRVGDDAAVVAEASDLLDRFGLADTMAEPTGTLAYGRQRVLEIALALASQPSVLLLDEPAAGVPEEDRRGILGIVSALPRDVTVLLIEHDMDLVFSFAERISVLVAGALLTEGRPEEVARDTRVREAYLGEAGHG